MTVKALFEYISATKPHPYPDTVLLIWLNELESRVQTDVLERSKEELVQYKLPEDANAKLQIVGPHGRLYRLWMAAMIDQAQGEHGEYQNSMAAFNTAWKQYACWHAEKGSESA